MRPDQGVEMHDAAFLWDMLRAAEDAAACVDGISPEQWLRNRMRVLALERALELLGEAAERVSKECRGAHPEIGWRQIAGQRNVIAHKYGEIDHRRLYETASAQLPRDRRALQRILKALEAGSEAHGAR
jgi:uncharacterized protein with HEPN domain